MAAALLIFAPGAGHAQAAGDGAEAAENAESGTGGWSLSVGALWLAQPAYPGAAATVHQPLPYAEAQWGDRLTLGGQHELGGDLRLVSAGPLSASVGVSYAGGRTADSAAALDGMGDLNDGVEVTGNLAAEWFFGGLRVAGSVSRILAGADSGTRGKVSGRLGAPVPGTDQRLILGIQPGVTVANAAYRNTRFGVDGAQAAATGYDRYRPGGGIVSYELPLGALYGRGQWQFVAFGGPARVSDDVAASPINRRRVTWQGLVAVAYRLAE